MAVYRCPRCGDTVRKEAKRCSTCRLWFDLEYEPVLDDGQSRPENVKKKEKKGAIIAVAVLVVFIAVAIAVSIGNARIYYEAVKRREKEGVEFAVLQSWPS